MLVTHLACSRCSIVLGLAVPCNRLKFLIRAFIPISLWVTNRPVIFLAPMSEVFYVCDDYAPRMYPGRF